MFVGEDKRRFIGFWDVQINRGLTDMVTEAPEERLGPCHGGGKEGPYFVSVMTFSDRSPTDGYSILLQ